MRKLLAIFHLCFISNACMTIGDATSTKEFKKGMPMSEIVAVAVSGGSEKLVEAQALIKTEKRVPELRAYINPYIRDNLKTLPASSLASAAQLYQIANKQYDTDVLRALIRHKNEEVSRKGWLMTAIVPSAKMQKFIRSEVDVFIVNNAEKSLLIPEFADSVRINRLDDFESLLTMGLLEKGHDAFAKALVELHPLTSAEHFLDYLSQADIEDLRQINQKSIDMYTSLVILRYFVTAPVPPSHPGIGHLYLYAVSRNPALSEMAQVVLDRQFPNAEQEFIFALAQQPVQVQVSMIEQIRQQPTSNFKRLLSGLKDVTRFDQVIEEINAISRF